MPFIEHGEKNGIQWTVEGKEAVDKRFFALVTVGKIKKITDKTYIAEANAKDAGIYLKDKTLANMRGE